MAAKRFQEVETNYEQEAAASAVAFSAKSLEASPSNATWSLSDGEACSSLTLSTRQSLQNWQFAAKLRLRQLGDWCQANDH
jgi:hypothetical protein